MQFYDAIYRLVCSTMAIFAGFTFYVVSVTKAVFITYITGKNWTSLLSEYKLNLSDHGFRQNPQGSNTGVRTKISSYRSMP